jgi:hypothetical protein
MTLEQLKEKARDEYRESDLYKRLLQVESIYSTRSYATPYKGESIPDMINRLIDSTHQATVEEIVGIIEGMPAFEFDGDGNALIRPADLIKAIKK